MKKIISILFAIFLMAGIGAAADIRESFNDFWNDSDLGDIEEVSIPSLGPASPIKDDGSGFGSASLEPDPGAAGPDTDDSGLGDAPETVISGVIDIKSADECWMGFGCITHPNGTRCCKAEIIVSADELHQLFCNSEG